MRSFFRKGFRGDNAHARYTNVRQGEIKIVQYFLWLLSMVPSFIFFAWPLALFILILSIVALASWSKNKFYPSIDWVKISTTIAFPFAILLYGTFYRAGENWKPQPGFEYAEIILYSILLLQLIFSSVLVFRTAKGVRFLSLCFLLWCMLVSLSSAFVSVMSVTGNWL